MEKGNNKIKGENTTRERRIYLRGGGEGGEAKRGEYYKGV